MSEEWYTGNGRKEYFDSILGRMVKLDSPIAFLCYQANQFRNLFHMTRDIVGYGDAVEELSLNDIETSKEAVQELLGQEE
jgi:hypothetical protein